MGFRAFCRASGVDLPQVPFVHPRDLLGREAGEAIQELRVHLNEQVTARMANPFTMQSAARELDVHRDTLQLRLHRLTRGFVIWPCFQNDGKDRPRLRAQRKLYFLDPLLARLALHRAPQRAAPPNYTVLTEQQLGVTLLRAREAAAPGTLPDFDSLLYATTPSRKEIDFTGAWLD